MRLQILKLFLEENIDKVKMDVQPRISASNIEYHVITNWNEIHLTLNAMTQYSFLRQYSDDILDLGFQFNSASPTLTLEKKDFVKFKTKHTRLIDVMESSLALLRFYIKDDDEDQINVLMPSGISIEEHIYILEDLNYIFNQSYINELNNKNIVSIKDVNSGSIWIILAITKTLTSIFGSFVKIAGYVHEKYLEHKMMEQRIRSLRIENDKSEVVLSALKASCDTYCRELVEQFASDNSLDIDNERLNSLTLAIDRMAKLMINGVEFLPSLKASESAKASFPISENTIQLAVDESKKLLSEGIEDSDEPSL